MVTHTSICDVTVGHNTTTLLLNSLFEICLVKLDHTLRIKKLFGSPSASTEITFLDEKITVNYC